jgi:Fe-S-cluster containining protein
MSKNGQGGQTRIFYNCERCPAFCCAVYERIAVTRRDIARLARYFAVTIEEATKRFTKLYAGERVLRRSRDPLFGQACMFLDRQTRRCSIYHARPQVCRDYPARSRCVYYDVLKFEQRQQDDLTVLPLVQITFNRTSADRNGRQ